MIGGSVFWFTSAAAVRQLFDALLNALKVRKGRKMVIDEDITEIITV
jgi:hypothetical protein